MHAVLVSRHHMPTSVATYEEVTLPACHMDGGTQAATIKMATDGYSTPVDVVQHW